MPITIKPTTAYSDSSSFFYIAGNEINRYSIQYPHCLEKRKAAIGRNRRHEQTPERKTRSKGLNPSQSVFLASLEAGLHSAARVITHNVPACTRGMRVSRGNCGDSDASNINKPKSSPTDVPNRSKNFPSR